MKRLMSLMMIGICSASLLMAAPAHHYRHHPNPGRAVRGEQRAPQLRIGDIVSHLSGKVSSFKGPQGKRYVSQGVIFQKIRINGHSAYSVVGYTR